MKDTIREKLDNLPRRPGVYLHRNAAGKVIYVGKAKSLRQRVRSYFQPGAQHSPRIQRLVAEIVDFDFIVVDTEMEALIVEANLIKRERPPYNVILRDDKSFLYVKLSTGDRYARASLVRRPRLDGHTYVGPFLPAAAARGAWKMVQRQFRVATCREVFDGKRRPCLYYHLDQCLAPCAGKTDPEEYGAAVQDAHLFLEGKDDDLTSSLESRMEQASRRREYEAAARFRDTLRSVRELSGRQRMSSTGLEDQDYLAHHEAHGEAVLQVFQVRAGKLQARLEFGFDTVGLEPPAIYRAALLQCYADRSPPPEIFLSHMPEDERLIRDWLVHRKEGAVRLRVPQRGEKRRFLDLVRRNAVLSFETRFRADSSRAVEALEGLAKLLRLGGPPYRIECFDVSNIQGTDNVASMVVWEGGKPRKSEYRIFNVRGVEGADDTASIAEVVARRYRRALAEDRRLPDLVVIDGGAGQLGAAVGALARVGLPMLPVISIAKRDEELHLQGGGEPMRLDRGSPALQLVQRIRDEAHRFAVNRHRRRRKLRTLKTELTSIPGVGPVTARKLLRAFGSVAGVRRAGDEALRGVAGERRAQAIRRALGPAPEDHSAG